MNLRFWEAKKPAQFETPKFKGQAFTSKGKKELAAGEYTRAGLWNTYDTLFKTRPEVSSAILAAAGHVVSRGYVTEPKDETNSKAVEAKRLCDDFASINNLDGLIYDGSILLYLHGNLFLENNYVGARMAGIRVFPWQKQIEPSKIDSDGTVLGWRQMKDNVEVRTFKENEIVALRFPPVDDQGFGSSIITSIVDVLSTRAQLDKDIKTYVHKTAFPKEIIGLGTAGERPTPEETSNVKSEIDRWEPGDVFVVNYETKYTAGGVGNVESRLFSNLTTILNDRCIDGLMVPPLSYLRNSTEASARAMLDNLRVGLIQPTQRLWKRAIEQEIFTPLLEGEGYDVLETLPKVSFTPPTEQDLIIKAQRVSMITGANIASTSWGAKQLDIPENEVPTTPKPAETGNEPPQPKHGETPPANQSDKE